MNANHLTPSATCLTIAPLLPMLDEPESDPLAVSAARAHLVTCAYCQQHLAQYATLHQALQARFTGPMLPQRRTEEIMRNLAQRDQTINNQHSNQPKAPTRRPAFISGAVAVATLVILALLAQVLFSSHRNSGVGSNGPLLTSLPNTSGYFTGISMISPTEGWATGNITKTVMGKVPVNTVVLFHYAHGMWSPVLVPVSFQLGNGYFTGDISMDSATDGWAVGSNDRVGSYVLHYANGAWQSIAIPPAIANTLGGSVLVRVQAIGAQSVWIGTQTRTIFHFDGTNWSSVDLASLGLTQAGQLLGFQMVSDSEGWATVTAGTGSFFGSVFLHFHQGSWIRPVESDIIPKVAIGGITMLSVSEGWALGSENVPDANGNTYRVPFKQHSYHFHNGAWESVAVPLTQHDNIELNAVGIASASDAWSVGADNSTIYGQTTSGYHSHSALLHWDGARWQRVTAPASGATNDGIMALSFGRANTGWAVGFSANIPSSNVVTTTDVLNRAVPLLWQYQNGAWSVYQQ